MLGPSHLGKRHTDTAVGDRHHAVDFCQEHPARKPPGASRSRRTADSQPFFFLTCALFLLTGTLSCDGTQHLSADRQADDASAGSHPGAGERMNPRGGPRHDATTERVIVRYASDADTSRVRDEILNRLPGARPVEFLRSANAEVYLVKPSTTNDVRTIEGVAGVRYAERSREGFETFSPDDAIYKHGEQWAPRQIGAEEAWEISRGDIGPGPDVGLLTTGYFRHPDLRGRVVSEYDCGSDDDRANPSGVHGTHVTGIVGAATDNGRGIAPEADLFVGRVLTESADLLSENVVECGDIAMKRGVKVISMSLGFLKESRLLRQAVRRWRSHGINVVASAGNYGHSTDRHFGHPVYPAASAGVIGVGATSRDGSRWPASAVGWWVDITAPGKEIVSTSFRKRGKPAYEAFSGTSQAAPHVAGVLACARANGKNRIEAERDLLERAYDRGPRGRDDYFGYGALNMLGAVKGKGISASAHSRDIAP